MTKTQLIPVAGYLRMSSDKQECSLTDQRDELITYAAKRGFKIVKWYTDEGISGWKGKQRHAFQSLIADAEDGEFRAVLCWDQSRFSRFDPMEANYYWHILRRENVFIETVKEGRLDFETLGGWLSASVQQHGKAEYVRSLAADTVRGRRRQILAGNWVTVAPYGYRLENKKLALADAAEVEHVRRIFQLRAKGIGYRAICVTLAKEGIAPVRAKNWSASHVREMLQRQTYLGHTVTGENPKGKFSHLFDDVTTMENTHPAIIDRELWDAVQRINGATRRRGAASKYGQGGGGHLAGLLRCGCCGGGLFSDRHRNLYLCSTYHRGAGCSYNQISYDTALKLVSDKIRSLVLAGSVEALTEQIERELNKRKSSQTHVDALAVKRQIAEIDRKVEGAAERLLEVEPALVKDVLAAMRTLKDKRASLVGRLEAAAGETRRAQSAKDIAAGLWRLDEVLRAGEPATVKAALGQIVDRVEIEFTETIRGKVRRTWKPTAATLFFVSTEAGSSGRRCC